MTSLKFAASTCRKAAKADEKTGCDVDQLLANRGLKAM